MNYSNIPQEMRFYTNWVCWKYVKKLNDKKPTKVPYSPLTGVEASVKDNKTWGTFTEACNVAHMFNGIGFVLSENDPYAFIDFDDCEGDQTKLNRQIEIYNAIDSYSEISPSGKGLHIIVKASIPKGCKRDSIEIYSNLRYMTMTGNIFRNAFINDYNGYINQLFEQMKPKLATEAFYQGLSEATETDQKIIDVASSAANGEKFKDLFFNGDWQKYNYPSQSEADFSLINMIAFYTDSKQQIQNIFLQSALGQREKSRAQYRINRMLNRCFDQKLPPVDVSLIKAQIEQLISRSDTTAPIQDPEAIPLPLPQSTVYSAPPGLVGELAQFIYAQSPRPVGEIALAGALGLMAGIVGRAYNVSGTGLNQFILLLGQTGVGKESIASGIDKLINAVVKTVPDSIKFIGPGEIASGQALKKYLNNASSSFVSVVGEFGIYLQQMAGINAPPYLVNLRRLLLDLYNKSGENKVLRESIYSDKESNTGAIKSPSVTILGESTPERFYEGLHEGMIAEGLLPRFLLIEYMGDRPPLNENHLFVKPDQKMVESLAARCAHALMLNSQDKTIQVRLSPEATEIFKKFDIYCDAKINSSDKEVRRQLWNRGHIKALKLAGLVAVGINGYDPIVDGSGADWAINVVVADIENIMKRFDNGDIAVSNDETMQVRIIIKAVKEFIQKDWQSIAIYAGDKSKILYENKVIPHSYLMRRLTGAKLFRADKRGATLAIKLSLKNMIEMGYLVELSKSEAKLKFDTSSICYAIVNVEVFK